MQESLFTPSVTVYDDGRITIDWSSSFDHTYDSETGDTVDDSEAHSAVLDACVAEGVSTAEGLRKLADYISIRSNDEAVTS